MSSIERNQGYNIPERVGRYFADIFVPKKELTPQEVPIYLSLGSHSEYNISALEPVRRVMEHHLAASRRHRIVYVMEDALAITPQSAYVQKLSKDGFNPSMAYAAATYTFIRAAKPTLEDAKEELDLVEKDSPFMYAELNMLDDLFFNFNRRVLLAPEGSPIERVREVTDQDGDTIALANIEKSETLIMDGQFDEAVPWLQAGVDGLATRGRERESLIVDKVKALATEEKPSLIVVRFGGVHTGIYHLLKNDQFNVSLELEDKKEGVLHYAPLEVAVRSRRFFPNKAVSQLDWYRTALGDTAYRFLLALVEEKGATINYSAVAQSTLDMMNAFTTMDAIREIEQSIREVGFVKTFTG